MKGIKELRIPTFFSMQQIKMFWYVLALFSFAYELPLIVISNFDKINPRLFDIVFLASLFIFGNDITKDIKNNKIIHVWKCLLIVMTVCVGFYMFFLPIRVSVYSIYYFFTYVEGYVVLKIMYQYRHLVTFRQVENIFILSGLFVALYSIPQYLSTEVTFVTLADGKTVAIPPGWIFGPYTSTYFSLAQVVPIYSLFALHRLLYVKGLAQKVKYVCILLFISFPALCSGSRTALFLVLTTMVIYLIITRHTSILVMIGVVCSASLAFIAINSDNSITTILADKSTTISRAESMAEFNSLDSRMDVSKIFHYNEYDYKALMPFIGGGYYVSPINGNYRVGYGTHNNYLFAFEQFGILGLLLFLSLLYICLKYSFRNRFDNPVSAICFAFILSLVIVGVAGQTFWRGFSTGNINNLILYIMAIGCNTNTGFRQKQA